MGGSRRERTRVAPARPPPVMAMRAFLSRVPTRCARFLSRSTKRLYRSKEEVKFTDPDCRRTSFTFIVAFEDQSRISDRAAICIPFRTQKKTCGNRRKSPFIYSSGRRVGGAVLYCITSAMGDDYAIHQ